MDLSIRKRLKNAYNVFMNKDPTPGYFRYYGNGSYQKPDRPILTSGNNQSIITSIYNRIAVDVSTVSIYHCQLDDQDRFSKIIKSPLNTCINIEANKDQSGKDLIRDIVLSMFDEGCIAIVPVDIEYSTDDPGKIDICSLRVGKITQWYPDKVTVYLYNDRKGEKQELTLSKSRVAIVENPFYSVMNEPNSTAKRLARKLALIDTTDEANAPGKLNMILQFPYVTRGQTRTKYAEERIKELEEQLVNSPRGIAYTDGTEKIIQLNRPIDNGLFSQVEYFTNQLFAQLSITQSILDGTADDKTMLNYNSRTIEPIVAAITDAMIRAFIGVERWEKGETILYFRDPFKLVPVNDIAEIADKLTRNEILTSNEIRQKIGFTPSKDPRADELTNSNIKKPGETPVKTEKQIINEEDTNNESLS